MAKLPFIKSASQQDLGRSQGPKPYKVGLALSGGGARGFAHAGALMALEEAGLKPEIVAGVSAGSVIAVLYGAGMRPLEMAQLFAKSSFRDFAEFSLGKGGFFRIDRFGDFILGAIKKYRNLEELPMPVLLGATDLDNGRSVIFDRGPIAPRLVASCSIPIVFKPVNINGVNYVDGGVLRNHPAWMLRDKCDLLIGVNVSPLRNDPNYNSVVSIAMRTYNLMAKANQSADMDLCDVSVQTTDIADMAVFDLKNIKRIFVSGYVQTRDALRAAGLWKPEQKEAAK